MERWGFIVPWCSVLRKRVQYYRVACEEDVWDIHKHSLDVILPTRRGDELNEYSDGREEVGTGDDNYAIAHATRHDKEAAFQAKFKRVREALALLAAVAHIDQTAWKYLLKQHCEVSFGDKVLQDGSEKCERELPAHFVLHMDHGGISGMPCNINSVDMEPTELVDIDLVQLCGVQQWENPSAEYLETLVKIAALDPHFRPERKAVEVIIPVQVEYYSERDKISQWELASIVKACRVINEQWEAYERGTEKTDVLPGSYRCTFMMGPINAEVTDGMALDLMSPAMEAVLRNNTWFSELALSAEMHNHVVIIDDTEVYSEYVDEDQARAEYRQLMTAVFGTSRRAPGAATARYYSDHSNVFQIEKIDFTTSRQLEESDLKAMMTALPFNQTVKKVSIRSEIGTIGRRNTWKWLAYGLFSKRAAEYSSLESFAITDVDSLSRADMEAFAAVIRSDHPEEILCNTPRGIVEERDATLKPGAPVRWQFRKYASSCDDTLAFESHVAHLRTFSDDGVSEWVAAIVPGVGPCHVRRQDLEFEQTSPTKTTLPGLKSFLLGFNKYQENAVVSDGLPQLLASIGASLTSLTLDGPRMELNLNVILRSCPQLEELSLCGGMVDVLLDFSVYRRSNQRIPELACQCLDVAALAASLSDPSDPLSDCVRKVRICLTRRGDGWTSFAGRYNVANIAGDLEALLHLLEVNRRLEYFSVIVPAEFGHYAEAFRQFHLEPTTTSPTLLPSEIKASFLSVFSLRGNSSSPRSLLAHLDRPLVTNIFSFVAAPTLRQVFFESTDWWTRGFR